AGAWTSGLADALLIASTAKLARSQNPSLVKVWAASGLAVLSDRTGDTRGHDSTPRRQVPRPFQEDPAFPDALGSTRSGNGRLHDVGEGRGGLEHRDISVELAAGAR